MRTRTTLAFAALAAFVVGTATGCALAGNGPWLHESDLSGETTTQVRDLDGFTGVSLSGSADLTVTQGDTFSVKVTADSALQEHIDTTVENSKLRIEQNYTLVGDASAVTVAVTVPVLTDVWLSGSSDATVAGIRGDALRVFTSGSSDIRVDGEMESLAIDISGSSFVALTGKATEFSVDISGSGDVTATGMTAAKAKVSVSGSGDVSLRVTDDLKADVSGSGDITYYGDPTVTKDTSGSGSVRRA